MTAVLQLKIAANLPPGPADQHGNALAFAEMAAYRGCFQLMAAASLLVIPGIFLFRPPRRVASEAVSIDS